jgi:hypothetical protein
MCEKKIKEVYACSHEYPITCHLTLSKINGMISTCFRLYSVICYKLVLFNR